MHEPSFETILQRIEITSYTWDRECHGLFDFDLNDVEEQQNELVGCGYV